MGIIVTGGHKIITSTESESRLNVGDIVLLTQENYYMSEIIGNRVLFGVQFKKVYGVTPKRYRKERS